MTPFPMITYAMGIEWSGHDETRGKEEYPMVPDGSKRDGARYPLDTGQS